MDRTELSADPLVNRWLNQLLHNRGLAMATVNKYGRFVDRLSLWLATNNPPCKLLNASIEQLELWTGFELHREKLRPQTRKIAVAGVKSFYKYMESVKVLKDNPAESLPSPKIGYSLPRPAQLQHAQALLMAPGIESFKGLRDTAMLSVLIGCGCRISGLVALNESDLIWGKNSKGVERLKIRFTEKGKKERIVPAPMEVGLLIRAYLGHPFWEAIEPTLPNGDRVLFINTINPTIRQPDHYGERRRIRADSFGAILKNYAITAGIPINSRHAHSYRHLYGTELAESDVDLLVRQALLGHAKPETTAIYSSLAMQKLFEIVDKSNPLGKIKTVVSDLANKIRSGK